MSAIANVNELPELAEMIAGGYITRRAHPSERLFIYNYTAKAQYENFWNEATLTCRGLIADADGWVRARPFRKFFNLDQLDSLPGEPFEVTAKLDGSLGILYWAGGQPFIATRGSFDSEQAREANRMLQNYPRWILDPEYTYLFEIIYPENRIVVDYGDARRLVLLAMIHTESGRELSRPMFDAVLWGDRAERIDMTIDEMRNYTAFNREGFVIRFASGLRVKVKLAEYVRLHKLLTGITERTIWRDYLMPGNDIAPLLDRVPDEFNAWLRGVVGNLRSAYAGIESDARRVFESTNATTRKEYAEAFSKSPYAPILFNMLDGKDYSRHIWKWLEPENGATFKVDEA